MAISPKNKKNLGKSMVFIGRLRPKAKAKPQSPGSAGTIYIKRDLLLLLNKQLEQSGEDEVPAKAVNEDASGH